MSKSRRQKVKGLVLPTLAGLALSLPAQALPTDPNVTHGTVTIQNGGAGTMQVLQGSNQAIVNWNSFGIAPGELVQFIQPGATSAILNRVTGVDPSQILGTLTANGQVFLINPNGILFGKDAQVNVGSFMASTLKMSDQDFLNKTYNLVQDPTGALAAVVNHGSIQVADGGFLVLASPFIGQDGLVVAKGGQIALGAGTQATVNFDGQGLMNFAVSNALPAGAQVMAHQDMLSAVQNVVNSSGLPEALAFNSIPGGVLVNSGQTRADSSGAQAGRVVLDSTVATYVTPTGVVSANGLSDTSAGGDARILSHGYSSLEGSLQATGGTLASGGFAELSGQHFNWRGTVETSGGTQGRFLLDPLNIYILPGPVPPFAAIDAPITQAGDVTNPSLVPVGNGDDIVYTGQLAQTANVILEADQSIFANTVPLGTFSISADGRAMLTARTGDILFRPTDTLTINGNPLASRSVVLNAPSGSVTLPNIVASGDFGSFSVVAGGNINAENINMGGLGSVFDARATGGDIRVNGYGMAQVFSLNGGDIFVNGFTARNAYFQNSGTPGSLTATARQAADGQATSVQAGWRPLILAAMQGDVNIQAVGDATYDLLVDTVTAGGTVSLRSPNASIRNNQVTDVQSQSPISDSNTIVAGGNIGMFAPTGDVRVGKAFSRHGGIQIVAGNDVTYRSLATGTNTSSVIIEAGRNVFGPTTFTDGLGIASHAVGITASNVSDLGLVSADTLSIVANSASNLSVNLTPSNPIYDPPVLPGEQVFPIGDLKDKPPQLVGRTLTSEGFGRSGTHLATITATGNVTVASGNTLYVGNVTAGGDVTLQATGPSASILQELSTATPSYQNTPAVQPAGVVAGGDVLLTARGNLGDRANPIPVTVSPGHNVILSAPNQADGIRVNVAGSVPLANVQFDVLTPPRSILFNSRNLFESLVIAGQVAPNADAQNVAVLTSFLNQSNFVGVYTLNLSNVITQDDWKSLLSGSVLWEDGE